MTTATDRQLTAKEKKRLKELALKSPDEELVKLVYAGEVPLLASMVRVSYISGTAELKTVPLVIGLHTRNKELVHAQVRCVIGAVDRMILGSDQTSALWPTT